MKHSVESFKVFKKCVTEYYTKFQEALLIKKFNQKLNKHLYAKGPHFYFVFLVIFWYALLFSSYIKLAHSKKAVLACGRVCIN